MVQIVRYVWATGCLSAILLCRPILTAALGISSRLARQRPSVTSVCVSAPGCRGPEVEAAE